MSNLNLPQEVLDLAQFGPIEDVMLDILSTRLPSIKTVSLIPESPVGDFILVRRDYGFGEWTGDHRFVDVGRVRIDTFTQDPDGDEKGAVLSEAVRVVLFNAWRENHHIPGHGWVSGVRMLSEASRKTDWATAAGPVQYADLPTGYWRYESKWLIKIRKQNT